MKPTGILRHRPASFVLALALAAALAGCSQQLSKTFDNTPDPELDRPGVFPNINVAGSQPPGKLMTPAELEKATGSLKSRAGQNDPRTADAARKASEASNAARRQLLADVSHELMKPVTNIRGYIESLAMPEVQLDAQTRARHVAIARRETHRLERLIGDLLDTVRFEAGAAAMDIADVPVADLFERVVNRHEYECRARNIELTASVAPGADGGTAKWRVTIDSAEIESTDNEAQPYRGTVKSSWYSDGRPVEPLGKNSNLPVELMSNGLSQDCWAFWEKESSRWSWE